MRGGGAWDKARARARARDKRLGARDKAKELGRGRGHYNLYIHSIYFMKYISRGISLLHEHFKLRARISCKDPWRGVSLFVSKLIKSRSTVLERRIRRSDEFSERRYLERRIFRATIYF